MVNVYLNDTLIGTTDDPTSTVEYWEDMNADVQLDIDGDVVVYTANLRGE